MELIESDLDYLFAGLSESEWRYFDNKRIFLTGGSGFIGKWLLTGLLNATDRLSLRPDIVVLTRAPGSFIDTAPHLALHRAVTLHQGDVRYFSFPEGRFEIVIHAATAVAKPATAIETFSTCIDGTQRTLEFAANSNATDFLLTSSGAIYGPEAHRLDTIPENFLGGPDPLIASSAYGEGKRASEWLASTQGTDSGLQVKIARIFAQVGPYLPLEGHFAMGNFLRDALSGQDLTITGDGSPVRSYLHAADTTIWLLSMLIKGTPNRAWNVGGTEAVSIEGLANRIKSLLGCKAKIRILKPRDTLQRPERYVPDVSRALSELAVPSPRTLDDAIMQTAIWLQNIQHHSR